MSLSRVKTWNPGDVLTAADLNGEFNNVLNNPISLVSPTTGAINFNLQAHTNLLPSVITASSGTVGQVLTIVSGPASAWVSPSVVTPSRVKNLRGVISSQTGTFTADSYTMRTSAFTQSWTVNATSSFSVSIGTAGPAANGRDQAAAFASTYVHWYAISTGSNSTQPQGLVSSNPPTAGPVALPTSYSGWTYLGVSPYTSASTTVSSTHVFVGDKAFFSRLTDNTLVSAGGSTALASVSVSSALAPNVMSFICRLSAGTQNGILSVDGTSTFYVLAAGAESEIQIPLTSGGLTYQTAAAGGTVNLFLSGYRVSN